MCRKQLVICEHGNEVGYVTGGGEISYTGEYDFVQSTLNTVENGYTVVVPAENQSSKGFDTGEKIKTASTDEMFGYVTGRLSGIEFLTFRVEGDEGEETE